ncbi:MAG: hypothetical protein WD005_03685 [Haliea sp.]
MTEHVFGAREALKARPVRRMPEPKELMSTGYELAREMVENCSAVSLAYCRQLLWRNAGEESDALSAHRQESMGQLYAGQSSPVTEGVMSFCRKKTCQPPPPALIVDCFPAFTSGRNPNSGSESRQVRILGRYQPSLINYLEP